MCVGYGSRSVLPCGEKGLQNWDKNADTLATTVAVK